MNTAERQQLESILAELNNSLNRALEFFDGCNPDEYVVTSRLRSQRSVLRIWGSYPDIEDVSNRVGWVALDSLPHHLPGAYRFTRADADSLAIVARRSPALVDVEVQSVQSVARQQAEHLEGIIAYWQGKLDSIINR